MRGFRSRRKLCESKSEVGGGSDGGLTSPAPSPIRHSNSKRRGHWSDYSMTVTF
jgi:hypothetical protein